MTVIEILFKLFGGDYVGAVNDAKSLPKDFSGPSFIDILRNAEVGSENLAGALAKDFAFAEIEEE